MNKKVLKELERLLDANGGDITVHDIVAEAARAKSPLHRMFEWDDTAAAQKYRLQQARDLLREYKITIKTDNKTLVISGVVAIPNKEGGGYRTVLKIARQEATKHQALIEKSEQVLAHIDTLIGLAAVWGVNCDLIQDARYLVQEFARDQAPKKKRAA